MNMRLERRASRVDEVFGVHAGPCHVASDNFFPPLKPSSNKFHEFFIDLPKEF